MALPEERPSPTPLDAAPPGGIIPTSVAAPSASVSAWQLPTGLEDHIADGVLKVAAGAAVGGLMGLALFRTGKGARLGSIMTGVGIGLGSTYERAKPLFCQNASSTSVSK